MNYEMPKIDNNLECARGGGGVNSGLGRVFQSCFETGLEVGLASKPNLIELVVDPENHSFPKTHINDFRGKI